MRHGWMALALGAALTFGISGRAILAADSQDMLRATWTGYPVLLAGKGRGGRSVKSLILGNLWAPAVQAVRPFDGPLIPEGGRVSEPVKDSVARVRSVPGTGGYYWVTARQEDEGRVMTASTVTYFSNPGPAPRDMLSVPKGGLEIVPMPLPREHSRYRETETWRFLVRYEGLPLTGHPVVLETETGVRRDLTTDQKGMVAVTFPEGVGKRRNLHEGHDGGGGARHHGPPRAGFVLAAEHEVGEKSHLTAFNATFSPGPYAGKSLWTGVGFAAAGMLLATPLLRRRRTDGKKGDKQ